MAIFEAAAFRGAPCCRRLRGSTLRRPFHGLTPTAKCWRRVRGSSGVPGLAPGGLSLFISSLIRRMAIWKEGLSVEHRAVAAYAAQHCAELSMGSRPRLSAGAAFAARLEPPGWRPGDYHYLYRRPSGAWQFGKRGSPWSTVLSPPTRLNSYAELSMGLRPRLSAGAALRLGWNPRAGARGFSLLKNLVPSPMS